MICFLLCLTAAILLLFANGPFHIYLHWTSLVPWWCPNLYCTCEHTHTQKSAGELLSLVSACLMYKNCLSHLPPTSATEKDFISDCVLVVTRGEHCVLARRTFPWASFPIIASLKCLVWASSTVNSFMGRACGINGLTQRWAVVVNVSSVFVFGV